MRHVQLSYVYIEDFKSFKGKNEIILSTGPGLKYVSGVNEVVPRLGSNGSGKTTVWDAIFWCWTGYSIRGHRASDLASWGTRSPKVITGFFIDDVDHYIERSGSPNRLFIDGTAAEQEEVDAFLLSRKRLLHSVFFGQSVDFFLDLDVPKRGELLDEVMNLDLWSRLSDIASKKATAAGTQLTSLNGKRSYVLGQYETLTAQEVAVAEANATWEADWRAEIEADTRSMQEIEALQIRDKRHRAEIARDLAALPDPTAMQKSIRELNTTLVNLHREMAVCQEHLAQNDSEHAFFVQHAQCPTCQQQITEAFRTHKLASCQSHGDQLQARYSALAGEEAEAAQRNTELQQDEQAMSSYVQELERDAALLDQRITRQQIDIAAWAAAIHRKKEATNNPHTVQLNSLREALHATSREIGAVEAESAQVEGERIKYDYWRTGFRRVRLYQVKQVIARLQLETANAAQSLGIGDWTIEYSTEVETKTGTMKSGIHITVKAPDGTIIVEDSGGEEQRVRLAVSMGVSSLIQEMAGIHFGFEVWDEPSAWLSAEGIDDMLDQLKDRANDQGRSIWLLDHNVLSYPDFSEKWIVRKTRTGSVMTQYNTPEHRLGITQVEQDYRGSRPAT